MFDATNLLFLCLLPLTGGLLVALLPAKASGVVRGLSLLVMLVVLAMTVNIFAGFDGTRATSCDLNLPWIADLGVNMHLAVDGLNLYLLLLTALLFPVVLLSTWSHKASQRPLFLSLVLLLQGGLLGTFLAQNLILFFVCWEAVLIPMFILILVFGGDKSRQAAQVFFLYTLAGSVLLLAAIILLGVESWQQTGTWSFEIATLLGLQLSWSTQLFIFLAIVLACAIKCPFFPFHSWLPLAYSEAPPAGTALMAGVLSKMGAFALIKLALPLCPLAAAALAPWLVALAVVSIVYGAIMALRQEDAKLLVAYSSLSHMGYIVLGIFSFYETALHGALIQTFSHGLIVGGLFLMLGLLEQRLGDDYRNVTALSTTAPRLAVVLLLFILSSVALPLTSGFTGEFMILLGAFSKAFAVWQSQAGALQLVAVVFACSGLVIGAGYMLRFARRFLFGTSNIDVADLRVSEIVTFLPLLLMIVWLGVAPAAYMEKVESAVIQVSERVELNPDQERDVTQLTADYGVTNDH